MCRIVATVVHTGGDRRVERLFYTTAPPDNGPVRPKTCRDIRFKTYCSSKEVCAFVGQVVTNES